MSELKDYFYQFIHSANYTALGICAIVILLLVLFANRFWVKLHQRLFSYAQTSGTIWNEVLLEASHYPIIVGIWLIGVFLLEKSVELTFKITTIAMMQQSFAVACILLLSWFLARLITEFERLCLEKPEKTSIKLDAQTLDVITKVAHFLIFVSMVLMVLQTIGVQITGLLAVGGFGGLIFGVASKDLLGNLLGGFIVYLDSPFKVGDTITSPNENINGTVERIFWRMTIVRTPEKQALYVPNSRFSSISIQNVTRMTNRLIKEMIGLRYDDINKLEDILSEIEMMLKEHPGIDQKMNIFAKFCSYGASSLDCIVTACTKATEMATFYEIRQEILLKVAAIVKSHGADFAFPTSTVYVPSPVMIEHAASDAVGEESDV